MQGLADGYFVLPATISDYLAGGPFPKVDAQHPAAVEAVEAVKSQIHTLLNINGTRSVASFHRELGRMMWDLCGMERSEESLRKALDRIPEIRKEFWTNVKVVGDWHSFNQNLEHAGRVADFIELAELMCIDALHRNESCGGHFRSESQTPEGEALRDDEHFAYVAAWEWTPENQPPVLHREDLEYEYVHLAQRSYK
jgi:succinate dehydrogenase / fumarate reductase flavoprotein subunit